MDPKLTLETPKKAIRQKEAVSKQQQELIGRESEKSLEEFNRGRNYSRLRGAKGRDFHKKCRCGKEAHARDKCPAREATCQEKGTMDPNVSLNLCLQLQEVQQSLHADAEESLLDSAFLNTIFDSEEKSWCVTIQVENQDILFKIDTGAEMTVISDQTFQSLDKDLSKIMKKQLYGPSHQLLSTLGQFEAKLVNKNQPVFVIKGLKNNLFRLPAITAL